MNQHHGPSIGQNGKPIM